MDFRNSEACKYVNHCEILRIIEEKEVLLPLDYQYVLQTREHSSTRWHFLPIQCNYMRVFIEMMAQCPKYIKCSI